MFPLKKKKPSLVKNKNVIPCVTLYEARMKFVIYGTQLFLHGWLFSVG